MLDALSFRALQTRQKSSAKWERKNVEVKMKQQNKIVKINKNKCICICFVMRWATHAFLWCKQWIARSLSLAHSLVNIDTSTWDWFAHRIKSTTLISRENNDSREPIFQGNRHKYTIIVYRQSDAKHSAPTSTEKKCVERKMKFNFHCFADWIKFNAIEWIGGAVIDRNSTKETTRLGCNYDRVVIAVPTKLPPICAVGAIARDILIKI